MTDSTGISKSVTGTAAPSGPVTSEVVTVGSMQPADVTAVPGEVVAEVLRDPSGFLAAAAEAAPGWAVRYGGPEGVAQLTSALHHHLAELTRSNAELRAATVVYLRTYPQLSLLTIARLLGVTKGAVQHVMRRAEEDSTRASGTFALLESPEAWRS